MKIALAFSGGGFRASSFSLGVLTYLDRIKIEGTSLLENVIALSTVSGGTITGAYYTYSRRKGKSLDEIYKNLYSFMHDLNLVDLGIDKLVNENKLEVNRIRSLITAFADVYEQKLLPNAKFGEIMQDNAFHLKHISFNATDFKTPLQFRFQWSEKIIHPKEHESTRGLIGNMNYKIKDEIAREIRLADIVAASSCFPGGFEPINFPDDFVFQSIVNIKAKLNESNLDTVGLMDGGILDNQGIEPLILADNRVNRNKYPDLSIDKYPDHALDLIILSDVASPYMKNFNATVEQPRNWWRRLTPNKILILNSILLILSLGGLTYSLYNNSQSLVILTTAIATVNILIFLLTNFLSDKLRKLDIIRQFEHPLRKLLQLSLGVYETMLVNRVKSVLKMTGDVYLKQIRRLNYKVLYQDKSWKNRLIMNAIYELRPNEPQLEKKKKENRISAQLVPSCKLQEVAEKAASMSTTLWFTEAELNPGEGEKSMLDTIIACGQFNICWNLLEYIEKLEKDRVNTNKNHDLLIGCKNQLIKDWNNFQINPYWMVEENH